MNKDKSVIIKNPLEIRYYPIFDKKLEDDEYIKISIDDIALLGDTFSSIVPEFKKVHKTETSETLYKMLLPRKVKHGEGLSIVKGNGFFGSVNKVGGSIQRKVFHEVKYQGESKSLSINPSTMYKAIVSASINKILESVKETQKELFKFLNQKEIKKLKSDVESIYQMLDSYKYNWDNRLFKNNNYSLSVIVRKESVNCIKFYHEYIADKFNKKLRCHSDRKIKKQIKVMLEDFQNYELAIYIYALSSFLEVVFLENYQENYLESVVESINKFEDDFLELHKKCYDKIESKSKTTIQSYSIKGFAGFNMVIGKTISKIPKIRDGLVDEKLIEKGEKVHSFNSKRTENIMEMFKKEACEKVKSFIDGINLINTIYNDEVEVFFDNEYLYISIDD